jgi:hypothetical protein
MTDDEIEAAVIHDLGVIGDGASDPREPEDILIWTGERFVNIVDELDRLRSIIRRAA